MKLYFISSNKNKFEEVQSMLPFVERVDFDLSEIQSLDPKIVIENKLLEASKLQSGPIIVEDTSLCLKGFNDLPGTFIKYFVKRIGLEGVVELTKFKNNDLAQAKTCIGYLEKKDSKPIFFQGVVDGKIVKPVTKSNFDWDCIFVPQGYTKTFAEMSKVEKNKISMRSIAISKLKKYLIK